MRERRKKLLAAGAVAIFWARVYSVEAARSEVDPSYEMQYEANEQWSENDTQPPSVTVVMDGTESSDGWYYYRADNCGIRVIFRDNLPLAGGAYRCEIDGRKDTRRTVEAAAGADLHVVEYSASEISRLLPDGGHVLSVSAADAAGNRCGGLSADSRGVRTAGLEAAFILDTKPPKAGAVVRAPNAVNQGVSAVGGRYYFNSAAEIEIEIRDASPEAGAIQVLRGEYCASEYDASAVSISEYTTTLRAENREGRRVCRDILDMDGVYRYFVVGCDRAGNPIEFAGGLSENGTTHHIVIDTTPPRGIVTVFDGDDMRFRMRTDGKILFAEPYCAARSLRVELRADTEVEHSPVTVMAAVRRSGDSEKKFGEGTFRYGNRQKMTVSGACSFQVTGVKLVDLAGNVTTGADSGLIYMDAEPPVITQVEPRIPAVSGRLYNADVPIRLRVQDSDKGGGSGVGDVICRIYENGNASPAEELVLHRRVQSAFEDRYREEKKIYEFETEFAVKSAHDSDDIRVVVSVSDNAGNGNEREFRLGIDAVPPEIEVTATGGKSGKKGYYRDVFEAAVTVRERHFEPGRIAVETGGDAESGEWEPLGGDVWRKTLRFSKDGRYALQIAGTDALGNEAAVTFADGTPREFVIDRTPPEVTAAIEGVEIRNGMYAGGAGELVVRVRDAHFGGGHALTIMTPDGELAEVTFSEEKGRKARGSNSDKKEESAQGNNLNEKEGSVRGNYSIERQGSTSGIDIDDEAESENSEIGVSVFRYRFDKEGAYSLSGSVHDLAGNRSSTLEPLTWIVDQTPPDVEILGVRDGSSNRTLSDISVRVSDEYLDRENIKIKLEGTRQGEIAAAISDEAAVMTGGSVSGMEDTAAEGSGAGEDHSKAADSTAGGPDGSVQIQHSESGPGGSLQMQHSESGPDGSLQIQHSESGPDGSLQIQHFELSPDGSLQIQLPKLTEDDYYKLRVTAVDLAGHETRAEASFSLNQNGPSFIVLEPKTENGRVREAVTPHIRIDDVDPVSIVSATLNGQAASYTMRDTEAVFPRITEDGKYVLALDVRDAAGNQASLPALEFVVDRTPPSAAISIEEGKKWYYIGDVTIAISTDDEEAVFSRLDLDGETLTQEIALAGGRARLTVPGERTGRHTLTAKLIDAAGNESEAVVLRFRIVGNAAARLVPLLLLAAAATGILIVRAREKMKNRAWKNEK